MAGEIYASVRFRPRPARYALTDEEFGELIEKESPIVKENGIEPVLLLRTLAGTPWRFIWTFKCPSLAAFGKFRDEAIMPDGLGMGQYIEYDIELCSKLGEE